MISEKLLLSSLCFVIPGLISGCSTQDVTSSTSSVLSPHESVARLNDWELSSQTSLLVGLKPYLGQGTTDVLTAESLHLKSVEKPLVLKDANGLVHQANEITIAWRQIALANHQTLQRQVVGPFASFESAHRVALKLQRKGLSALVAHPKDWEVWLPEGVKVPEEVNFLLWKKKITSEIRPVLKGLSGELLLSGPVKIEAPDGLKLNDGIYLGPFWLQSDAYGTWTFIEEVPLERYLLGVVPYEIGANAPPAALAAQAVLARTWALANTHRFAIDGYHLCSDTQCQVYKDPSKASQSVRSAISNTAGRFLKWQNKPIHAVYHATNGGVMAAGTEAWAMAPLPYLQPQLDGSKQWKDRFVLPLNETAAVKDLISHVDGAYGSNHPRFRWTRTFDAVQLKKNLLSFEKTNTLPSQVKVLKRGASGRVLALEILEEENQLRRVLRFDEIRRVLRRLPSTLFVVNELQQGLWQFSGGGFGHGAGLSQAGAIDLALRGWKAQEILKYYYPGTSYGTLQDLPKAP